MTTLKPEVGDKVLAELTVIYIKGCSVGVKSLITNSCVYVDISDVVEIRPRPLRVGDRVHSWKGSIFTYVIVSVLEDGWYVISLAEDPHSYRLVKDGIKYGRSNEPTRLTLVGSR